VASQGGQEVGRQSALLLANEETMHLMPLTREPTGHQPLAQDLQVDLLQTLRHWDLLTATLWGAQAGQPPPRGLTWMAEHRGAHGPDVETCCCVAHDHHLPLGYKQAPTALTLVT
jgi:hypothetical protein